MGNVSLGYLQVCLSWGVDFGLPSQDNKTINRTKKVRFR